MPLVCPPARSARELTRDRRGTRLAVALNVAAEAKKDAVPSAPGFGIPLAIISIVLMMVLPVPPFLLDGLLALSLAIAVGVFLIALFIEQPLDYSAFPAIVLVATLLRLSLNVATTRLVLLHGAEGNGAAGKVVETFGRFVVGGNVLVGLVVFLILVIINFVVITKGAGRIAEVAARFTLDAMPGKQMAIDADLNAGLINQDERARAAQGGRARGRLLRRDGRRQQVRARRRGRRPAHQRHQPDRRPRARAHLGASTSRQAVETFSILSVGDALVSQIPALLDLDRVRRRRHPFGDRSRLGSAFKSQLLGSRTCRRSHRRCDDAICVWFPGCRRSRSLPSRWPSVRRPGRGRPRSPRRARPRPRRRP